MSPKYQFPNGSGLDSVGIINSMVGESYVLEGSSVSAVHCQSQYQHMVVNNADAETAEFIADVTYTTQGFYELRSSTWDEVIGRHIPVLTTYQDGLSTANYRPHFLELFRNHLHRSVQLSIRL